VGERGVPERLSRPAHYDGMRIAYILLAPLALAACAIIPAGPLAEGTPVALGQPVRVGNLIAVPEKVIEDSRCPINARCVWAGRAIVSTRIDGQGWQETTPLTLGEPYATHGTTITLVSVEPGQLAGKPTDPKDYRFVFEGGQ